MKIFTYTCISFLLAAGFLLQVHAGQQSTEEKSELLQPFHDNVEWHDDFTIDNIQGWIMLDEDGLVPDGPFQEYPNNETPQSFIVYNPSQTSPPNTFPEFQPRSGSKVFMSVGNNGGANNDWMITNELAPHNGGTFSFYAKGTFDFFGDEEFKVGYSTTGTAPSDFTFFNNGVPTVAGYSWTNYEYSIPATAKHITIVHVSYAYCLMVDDISFIPTLANQAPGAISDFSTSVNMEGGLSVNLTWTNPVDDMGEEELSELEGVKIFRGSHPMSFTEIAEIPDPEIGGAGSFSDNNVEIEEFYAYRLVGYNSHGLGQSWTSDFLYLAVETIPGAPNEVFFERNELNQTVISWNEVNYGAQGGILQDPVTGYTVIRNLGSESETLVSMHPETSFTETDDPALNMYTYHIIAHTSTDNFGAPAERHFYSGMNENQEAVTWGTTESEQVFELTRSSILSQSIYTPEEVGSTGLITGLSYFSNIGEGERTNNYKIYMSTTVRSVFGTTQSNLVWQYFGNQKLVFEGPITFEAGRKAIEIALDQPFFFDQSAGRNLIITVIKPLTEELSPVTSPNFFNTPVEGLRTYYAIGYGVDMSTITTQPASWATEEVGTIPSIVAARETNFGTLAGNVVAGGENLPLEGVSIEIVPAEGANDTWQQETTTTDEEGNYAFPALLPGDYSIVFFKEGYNSWETELSVAEGQNQVLDVVLSDATPVVITGAVTNSSGGAVAGAQAILSGYSSYTATTDEAGIFTLNAFGEKEYDLQINHPLYYSSEQSFTTENNDFTLETIALGLQPHKPMNVVAEIENGSGQVNWDVPYGLDNETGLQWGSLTHYTGWGWGGAPFTAGIRFTISDLQSLVPEDGKLTHVKAYIANQANIHIEVFEGHQAAELIYTRAETISEEGWYTFELDRAIPIDITKELWIGIRFEAGYGAYPIGIDEGPNAPQKKGSMLYENGTWTQMSLTNKNWNIYGIVHNTVEANPTGYKVYRGLSDTDTSNWENLTPDLINVPEWLDETLADAPSGVYRYGVVAHYEEDLVSEMTKSNELMLDVLFNIHIVLQPNTGTAEGTYLSITGQEHFYEKTFAENELETTIDNVWHGTYDIAVQLENYEPVIMEDVVISESMTLEIPLAELKPAPANLRAEQEPGSDNYLLSWTLHDAYVDNIESYPDFEKQNIGNYILQDLDGMETYTYTNFTWPGAGDPISFMVFNPYATIPAINLDAYSGRRYLTALAGPSGQNNDWLIIPAGEGRFSFMAQSLVGSAPETFNVLYSLEGSNVADFTAFETGTNITAPDSWTEYAFNAPQNTQFVAINYTGNDTYILLIDDLEFEKEYVHALSYNIYLDGDLIAEDVLETNFQVSGLTEEFHLAEIEAVYTTGVSERTEIQLEGTTHIAGDLEDKEVKIFPNPSRGTFSIRMEEDAEISILNLHGIEVYHENIVAGESIMNPGIASGTYVILIQTRDKSVSQKLIIQ